MFYTTKLFYFVLSTAKTKNCNVRSFQAVQESSIGDIVTHSLSQWVSHLLISAKTMKDNERRWKTMKDKERQRKTMKDNERQWKAMKDSDRDRDIDSNYAI